MITEALLDLVEGLVGFLVGLLPVSTVEPFGAWGSVVSALSGLNYWLPISEVFTFVLAVLALVPVLASVSLAMWLAAFVRGGSARG